ncbi:MAG TPA: response regulator [Rhodopila sp.]|nr:response regulator [Rhodopila sp.]
MIPDGTEMELRIRLRQQEILAAIGTLALRGGPVDDLFQETARLVANGLETRFCKVMEYRPDEQALLIRAGVGWRDGVVGHMRIGADVASPAGYALKTGQEVICNDLATETRFETPQLLRDHGIVRAINVIIRTEKEAFGVLEVDSMQERAFEPHDVAFMQAAANLLGIALDRKYIEAELAQSHARISEVLESISDAFYTVDHDWRFIYFNRNAEVLWRRRRNELVGRSYLDEFPRALGSAIHETHLRAARERRVLNIEAQSPVLGRWLDVSVFPSADGLSVYMRDITERKETETALQAFTRILEDRVSERTRELAEANTRLLEEIAERKRAEAALMQAQRLEAIGQLTGGVAHDFNNLLTAVIGNLELLQRSQTTERAQRQAEAALQAAQRGGALTRQLLAYARKQHVEPRPLDVNTVVDGMRDMLRRSLGGLVTIETNLATGNWLAMADPVQVESIVLNLAINARDAMPDGGVLQITTEEMPAGAPTLPGELEHRDYIMVAVSDGGTGMPPAVANRAFEPFFTTKEIGKGSGLGLAQVHGVATQFGGTARLRSTPGVGTTVEVFLPRAPANATEPVPDAPLPVPAAPVEGVRVLVVDDQDDVRAVAAAFLEEAGYAVDQMDSGAAALMALPQATYALALVDHGMAGMSGADFVRKARERHPDLKVIYVTGHAEPLDEAGVDARDTVLTKPYEASALLAAVQRRLMEPR